MSGNSKKKNKNKGKSAAKPAAPAPVPEPVAEVSDAVPAQAEVPVAMETTPSMEATAAETSAPSVDTNALEAENAALKAEIEQLKATLASKDAEIEQLKSTTASATAVPQSVAAAGKTPADMGALQERLAKLKKDQAEADAARDSAWQELKRCVSEVVTLSNAGLKESQAITSN